jgi:hypothetical protein
MTVMSHVPLATMSRLSTMTTSDVEPAELRVAARLPEVLEPQPQGVKVRIRTSATGSAMWEEFVLEAASETRDLEPLASYARNGTRLWAFRLTTADVARLQQMTTNAARVGTSRGVEIAAGVDACRRGPLATNPLPTTTLLRTNRSGYFVLTEDLDLRAIASERDLAANVPNCK